MGAIFYAEEGDWPVPVGDLYPRKIHATGKQFDSATLRSNHITVIITSANRRLKAA